MPVTARDLIRQMERLLVRVAPRVVSDTGLPGGEPAYVFIEPAVLVRELEAWNHSN